MKKKIKRIYIIVHDLESDTFLVYINEMTGRLVFPGCFVSSDNDYLHDVKQYMQMVVGFSVDDKNIFRLRQVKDAAVYAIRLNVGDNKNIDDLIVFWHNHKYLTSGLHSDHRDLYKEYIKFLRRLR